MALRAAAPSSSQRVSTSSEARRVSAWSGARRPDAAAVDRWEDDGGPLGLASPGSSDDPPARDLIAYHEAGHAAVGHHQGLALAVIYVGDASGQVIFDRQWGGEAVVRDADLLDRYGLMLLAGGLAEQRGFGGVRGAQQDAETLERMLREARRWGTLPRPGLWPRAEQQVAEHWAGVEALADELEHRGEPVADLAGVLAEHPHLGETVTGTSGARAKEILDRSAVSV
jgi:hypothetical protein